MVPTPFLKPTAVNGADPIVHAVDTDFIGPESDNVTVLDMSGMYRAVFLVSESFQEDPKRRERGGRMCVGDFGEWGDKGRVDDVLVDYEGGDTESDYGGYGKHLEISIRTLLKANSIGYVCITICLKRRSEIWVWFSALRYRYRYRNRCRLHDWFFLFSSPLRPKVVVAYYFTWQVSTIHELILTIESPSRRVILQVYHQIIIPIS